eukprot:COSAG04_NODE_541_length_12866_cov_847.972351_13_plen_79_part_00
MIGLKRAGPAAGARGEGFGFLRAEGAAFEHGGGVVELGARLDHPAAPARAAPRQHRTVSKIAPAVARLRDRRAAVLRA